MWSRKRREKMKGRLLQDHSLRIEKSAQIGLFHNPNPDSYRDQIPNSNIQGCFSFIDLGIFLPHLRRSHQQPRVYFSEDYEHETYYCQYV